MTSHILNNVIGWRKDNYDGYNDHYVNNPQYINNEE